MYRFLSPNPDGTVTDIGIETYELDDAFYEFAERWKPAMTAEFAVWHGDALCAIVRPVRNAQTGLFEPVIEVFNPPRHGPFGCTD